MAQGRSPLLLFRRDANIYDVDIAARARRDFDLHRRLSDRVLAGVAGGVADRLGVPAGYVRAAFVVAGLLWGLGVVLYVALWIATFEKVEDRPAEMLPVERQVGLGLIFAGGLLFFRAVGWWPGDLVVTVTGDGGFRCVGAAALHPALAPHRDKITFTTVGGGDACDLQHSLHGKHDKRSPTEIIQQGIAVPVAPLSVQVGGETHPAFSYAGFGQSGEGSFIVNNNTYRAKSRLRRESGLLLHAIVNGPEFEIEERRTMAQYLGMERGERQRLAELTVSISPYMARNGRFPVRHWDNEMFVQRVRPGTLRAVVGLSRFVLGHPIGGLHEGDSLNFTTLSRVDAQFDGEPVRMRSNTDVSVSRTAEVFTMLASPRALPREMRHAA